MKIAVISNSIKDFWGHKQKKGINYIPIISIEGIKGTYFNSIEIAPDGKENPNFDEIEKALKLRIRK